MMFVNIKRWNLFMLIYDIINIVISFHDCSTFSRIASIACKKESDLNNVFFVNYEKCIITIKGFLKLNLITC